MGAIKASVGIRNGKQCYNVVSDQLVVIGLLNAIAGANGGTRERPLSTSPRYGTCSNELAQAILNFQQIYSLSADGHVDPGGQTIYRMNLAANIPSADPAAGGGKTGPTVIGLDDYWHCTALGLSNAQYGAGLGGGVFAGPISFARGNVDRAFKTMKGGQVVVGYSGATPEEKAADDAIQAAKSRAVRMISSFAKSLTGGDGDWWSENAGACVSLAGLPEDWKRPLEADDFNGTCFGFNLSAGTFVGLSGWILVFGMPSYFWAAVGIAMVAETPTLGLSGIALAALLSQSKGIAFIGTAGIGIQLTAGVSVGNFVGLIS